MKALHIWSAQEEASGIDEAHTESAESCTHKQAMGHRANFWVNLKLIGTNYHLRMCIENSPSNRSGDTAS